MKKLVFISAVIGLVSCNGVKKETSSVSSFFVSLQYPMIKGL
jgi:hypothetical protein